MKNADIPAQNTLPAITWLSLFSTTGTLLCCALPIIFVSLGLGTTVAAVTSSLPFLVTLSQYKLWVFTFSGMMLLISAWLIFRPGHSCPVDSETGQLCSSLQQWHKRIFWSSVLLWSTGYFAAFLSLPVMIWMETL